MKTKWFYLGLLVFAIGMSSCSHCDCDHSEGMRKIILDLQVDANEWQYSNAADNNYYYATFTIPDLNAEKYNNGQISVYREYDSGTVNATQTLLPAVRHKEYVSDEATNTLSFYTETIDYEYGIGTLTIFYTLSDFEYEEDAKYAPGAMHFRLMMVW